MPFPFGVPTTRCTAQHGYLGSCPLLRRYVDGTLTSLNEVDAFLNVHLSTTVCKLNLSLAGPRAPHADIHDIGTGENEISIAWPTLRARCMKRVQTESAAMDLKRPEVARPDPQEKSRPGAASSFSSSNDRVADRMADVT